MATSVASIKSPLRLRPRYGFLDGFDEGFISEVLLGKQMVSIEAGTTVYQSGDPASQVYFVTEGYLRREKVSDRGQKKIVGLLHDGDVFGENAVFGEISRDEMVIAVTNSIVEVVDAKELWTRAQNKSGALRGMLRHVHERAQRAEAEIEELVFLNLYGRLGKLLLSLAERYGVQTIHEGKPATLIDLALTHQEIAQMLGATRETISKALNMFKRDGAIANSSSFITIVSEERLSTWIR
ncbi:MAG: Crp/Fnr family transcriptional regulator [Planctomycetes bacterium]|nr:Crp/Fnr family transcriptional regulator [Planctomycetota bacterium]